MFTRVHLTIGLGALAVALFVMLALGIRTARAAGPICDGNGCYFIHTTTDDFVRGDFYATGLRKLEDGEVQLLPVGLSTPWQVTTALPGARAELTLVSHNNILYAIGGIDPQANYHTEIYSATTSLVGDITVGWELADNLPEARAGAIAVVALVPDPVLYVIGGGTGAGSNTIYYKKIGAGGELGGSWNTATLPENLVYSGAIARENNLYVFGGTSFATDHVYRIPITNADGNLGAAVADLTLPKRLTMLGTVEWQGEADGFVYNVGGMNEVQESSQDVYFTHFNQDGTLNNDGPVSGWENASLIDAFNAHGTVQYNGAIYVIGGRQGIASTDAVTKVQTALIDPDGSLHNWGGGVGNWIVTEPLPQARFFHGATANQGGELFIAGGYNSQFIPTNTVYHGSTTGAASTYAPLGEYIGEPFDGGSGAKFSALKWNATVENTAQVDLTLYYRAANSLTNLANQSWTLAGASAQSATGFTNTVTFPAVVEQRFLQYRAVFTTNVSDKSPQLNAVVADLFTEPTPTPTATSTATNPPSATDTPTGSPTLSPTPTLTETPSPTLTNTPTDTSTPTSTNTLTPSATLTASATPTVCASKPAVVKLASPNDKSNIKPRKVTLAWDPANCAQTYKVIVKKNNKKGPKVFKKGNITKTQVKTKKLAQGQAYVWRVRACNVQGCSKWSGWWKFKIIKGNNNSFEMVPLEERNE